MTAHGSLDLINKITILMFLTCMVNMLLHEAPTCILPSRIWRQIQIKTVQLYRPICGDGGLKRFWEQRVDDRLQFFNFTLRPHFEHILRRGRLGGGTWSSG
jgi:hypothetical protein